MKKRTKVFLIAGIVVLLVILSPTLVKLRCQLFLFGMNHRAAVYTISETHIREYAGSPDRYLDSTETKKEWFHSEAGVYYETVSTGGNVSYYLNGSYKNAETGYTWQRSGLQGKPVYKGTWRAYTWKALDVLSVSPVSVRIDDGMIQVVFHTVNSIAKYATTEHCFRFNFLLQFDSIVTKSVIYADEDHDPNKRIRESTTVRKIVSLDKDAISDKFNEQYALIKGVS